MKKLFSTILVLSSLVGSFALASTSTNAPVKSFLIHPLDNCPPVPTRGGGMYCPEGDQPYCPNHSTRPEPRWCKGSAGMYQCGWVCVFDSFSGGT